MDTNAHERKLAAKGHERSLPGCVGEYFGCEHPHKVGSFFSDRGVCIRQKRDDGGYRWECERVECGYPFNCLSSHFGFRVSKCLNEERQGCFWLCKFQPGQGVGGRDGHVVVIVMQPLDERWAQRAKHGLVTLDYDDVNEIGR